MRRLTRFSLVLVAIGLLMASGVVFDLARRGLHRYPERPEQGPGSEAIELGREAIVRYGCGACHVIPGVRQATGRVGPRLEDLVNQSYLAGVLPNTEEYLAACILEPREINPLTAMPDLEVTAQEAQEMAAYLYSPQAQGDLTL